MNRTDIQVITVLPQHYKRMKEKKEEDQKGTQNSKILNIRNKNKKQM